MFEGLKNLFKQQPASENIYNLTMRSPEKPASGWYREYTQAETLLGLSWSCPGKLVKATVARAPGSTQKDADGNLLRGGVDVEQRFACSFSSPIFPPELDGFQR